jgi:hypothetical protein
LNENYGVGATPPLAITSRPWLYGALYSAYADSLIGDESYVAFTMPNLINKTYPFTAFPMYRAILAKRPFHLHQAFEGCRVTIEEGPERQGMQPHMETLDRILPMA